ncbi:MAG: hypothetical protein KKF50_05355 [Nanoarchaeota archaeon]|nr:hypothetical protein [Nanoarchaeota archaeon]
MALRFFWIKEDMGYLFNKILTLEDLVVVPWLIILQYSLCSAFFFLYSWIKKGNLLSKDYGGIRDTILNQEAWVYLAALMFIGSFIGFFTGILNEETNVTIISRITKGAFIGVFVWQMIFTIECICNSKEELTKS